jgi:hypothetical protein
MIPIYFAVEEAIDSDEFDKDSFDGSGPTVTVRQLPAPTLGYPNSKFGMFYNKSGG